MYRDNLEAAHMRIAELEKENKELKEKGHQITLDHMCSVCRHSPINKTKKKEPEKKIICKLCDRELWRNDLEIYKDDVKPILCYNCWFSIIRTYPVERALSIHDIELISKDHTREIYYVHIKDSFTYEISKQKINILPKVKWEKMKQGGRVC